MSVAEDIPPVLSSRVTISAMDHRGRCVVKVKKSRKPTYLQVGRAESFLLAQFDGSASYSTILARYQQAFGDKISYEDVKEFVDTAAKEGLLSRSGSTGRASSSTQDGPRSSGWSVGGFLAKCVAEARRQSPLYFRVTVFNPDATLDWLEPKLRWLFTVKMGILSAVLGVVAIFTTWVHWPELAGQFHGHFGWRMIALFWMTLVIVTVCHEFGHGIACKKYGGEVREMGFLWYFFTPCFFCNVSDAWLLPNRWQRLLISMAGTYVDFLIWIVAVFVWRIAAPNTSLGLVTWTIVTTCGLRVTFNINPLFRLDGYYATADLLGVHNLRRRARARLMEFVRCFVWGGARPKPTEDGRTLLAYGLISWCFVVGMMTTLTWKLADWLQPLMGIGGPLAAGSFFYAISHRYFKGSLGEDFRMMFRKRKWRAAMWLVVFAIIFMIPISDRAGGSFFVRPMVHWEIRATVAGFLREVTADEGEATTPGTMIARLEVPELSSQISRQKLEIAESEAKLRQLVCGPRPELMAEQEQKIERARMWRDLAESDLTQAQVSFQAELEALGYRISEAEAQLEYRTIMLKQANQLFQKGGLAGQQLLSYKRQVAETEAVLQQIRSETHAREASGVLQYEAELARREKGLADEVSELKLLQAGTRPEEIEAEQAHLRRLKEELKHFLKLEKDQIVECPVSGTVTTPRVKEKIGQFLQLGELICTIEDLRQMEAEIAVSEQDAYILAKGQRVSLRPRSLPFECIEGTVKRIAPATRTNPSGIGNTNLAVYCQVDNDHRILRTGMTGFGRVHAETKPFGLFLLNKVVRLLRTEFWW